MNTFDYTDEFNSFRNELISYLFRLTSNHYDSEDIVQDTYIKVHQHIDSFKGESSFKTWVFAIATNQAKTN